MPVPSSRRCHAAIDLCTLRVVGVCGGGGVVVAGRGVGATGDLVGIADAIVIGVVVYDVPVPSVSRAGVAGIDLEDAEVLSVSVVEVAS